jgi:microcystin-dependent protein
MSQRNYLGVQDYPIPVGTIIPVIGIYSQYNDGFLICDGTSVSRTTWAKLFSVIGTQFGAGDGSTTFNIPNLTGAVPKGSNVSGGASGGSFSGTINYTLAKTNLPSLSFSASGATLTASLGRNALYEPNNTETPIAGVGDRTGLVSSSQSSNSSVNVAISSLDVSYTGGGGSQSAVIAGSYQPPSYQMIYLIKGQESFGHQLP